MATREQLCDALVVPLSVHAMQVLAHSNVHVSLRVLEFSNWILPKFRKDRPEP